MFCLINNNNSTLVRRCRVDLLKSSGTKRDNMPNIRRSKTNTIPSTPAASTSTMLSTSMSFGVIRTTTTTLPRVRERQVRRLLFCTRATGPGGGVLDKPSTAFPKFDLDKNTNTQRKKPPRYQVMLHNDEVNRREYVVKVLLKIVPTLTMDDAVNIMNEAHFNGLAAVIVCGQEEAEDYCEGLRNNGLISTIEPVSGGGGGGSGS